MGNFFLLQVTSELFSGQDLPKLRVEGSTVADKGGGQGAVADKSLLLVGDFGGALLPTSPFT